MNIYFGKRTAVCNIVPYHYRKRGQLLAQLRTTHAFSEYITLKFYIYNYRTQFINNNSLFINIFFIVFWCDFVIVYWKYIFHKHLKNKKNFIKKNIVNVQYGRRNCSQTTVSLLHLFYLCLWAHYYKHILITEQLHVYWITYTATATQHDSFVFPHLIWLYYLLTKFFTYYTELTFIFNNSQFHLVSWAYLKYSYYF